MRLRRTAVAALLAAGLAVPAFATAAVAAAQPGGAHPTATAQKSGPKPAKTRKPVRIPFAASGRVTAVDAAAGTLTVLAKGGTKDVRKRTVTVTVPSTARIVVNEVRGTLAAVTVGARVTVTGTRVGTTYTATRVQAKQSAAPVVTPAPAPSPSPSVEPGDDGPTSGDDPAPGTSADPDDDPSGDDNSGDLSD